MPSRSTLITSVIFLLIATMIGGYAYVLRQSTTGETGAGTALIGGPFALTDQSGKRVTEKDFLGKYMLVFFGYTYCPDVCPTELQVMSAALDMIGARAERIQPVFVTVDPERDTPEVMKSYVENFGPRLTGLTGSAADIAAMAKVFRVYYARAGEKDSADYLMDHSSIIYLMDPDGRFLKHFTYTTDARKLADDLLAATSGSP